MSSMKSSTMSELYSSTTPHHSALSKCQKCSFLDWPQQRYPMDIGRKRKSRLKFIKSNDIEIFKHSTSPFCPSTLNQNAQSQYRRCCYSRKNFTNCSQDSKQMKYLRLTPLLSLSQYIPTLLVILYILTVLPLTTADPTWLTPPSDTNVRLSENAIVTCEIENFESVGYKPVEWRQYFDDNTDITLFINDSRLGAPPRYNVIDNGYGFSLELNGAQREDDADVQCGISVWEQKRIRLTVLVDPEPPQIELNQTSPHTEYDIIEITCSSTGGNPPPIFTWYRNGTLLPVTEYIHSTTKYGTSYSKVVRQLDSSDDGLIYTCQVENQAILGAPISESITLDVQYAPIIDLGPYDPYKVIEFQPVTLACDLDANPMVTNADIIWYKDGTQIPGKTGFVLQIPSVQRTDAGVYECEATNTVGTGSGDTLLDVIYGPEISLQFSKGTFQNNKLRIDEEQDVNMSSVVDSNPPVLHDGIQWYREDDHLDTAPNYFMQDIERSETGNYSCHASVSVLPSGSTDIITLSATMHFGVQVLYVPGTASIVVPNLVVKGEATTLSCSVDEPGEPRGDLLWSRPGHQGDLWNGSLLHFPSVELTDQGDYICTPQNEIGSGQSDIQLIDVKERPELSGDPLPQNKTVQINTSFEITCFLRGKPIPTVHWYKDGVPLVQGDGFFTIASTPPQIIDINSWNITSTLKWQGFNRSPTSASLSYLDRGNYSCKGVSELGHVQTDMQLFVQYPPSVVPGSEKVAIDRNQSATMSCVAHSYPNTVFEWYNETNKIVPGGRIEIRSDTIDGQFPYQTLLTIVDVSNFDLGNYFCRGCNNMGCTQESIELLVKDVPDGPTDLQIGDITWESVELMWNGGFDGGYPQEFEVIYRFYDNHTQSYMEKPAEAGDVEIFNLTKLLPAIQYTFRVYSKNVLGPSDPSNSITAVTPGFTVAPPSHVQYDTKERILVFASSSSNYCARIEINSGNTWEVYAECAPTEGSILISDGWDVRDLRVALCLTRREDVCSAFEYAEFVGEDLSKGTIIIVGCVCGGVVIILTIVLIVLCCKRQKAKENYEKQQETRPMHPVVTAVPSPTGSHDNPSLKPAIKGLDNPALVDQVDHSRQTPDGVFSTSASGKPPGNAYNYHAQPNGHPPNGQVPHDRDIPSWNLPPSYDNQRNNDLYRQKHTASPIHKNMLYLDDPYRSDHIHKDIGNRSDSGVSTPDPQKPKKVIYEVVV